MSYIQNIKSEIQFSKLIRLTHSSKHRTHIVNFSADIFQNLPYSAIKVNNVIVERKQIPNFFNQSRLSTNLYNQKRRHKEKQHFLGN